AGRASLGGETRVTLVNLEGVVVADSGGDFLGSPHPPRHVAKGLPVLVDGARVGTIMAGSMVDSSLGDRGDLFLASITRALLVGIAASSAAALVLGAVFSAALLRPLRRLTRAFARVAGGDLAARVPVEGDEELALLAASFNGMTEELAALEEEKRRVIADSAHELRTPVTLIRGTVEAMLDGIYPLDEENLRSVHEETLRLSALIDALRELQLIDSGKLRLEKEPLDPAELAESAAAGFRASAERRRVALSLRSAPDAPARVEADRLRLTEVLYNLLSNALRHVSEGGSIELSLARGPSGGLRLSVEDSGPGVPPGERERIFERFYRLDSSRSTRGGGRGLGLAIAREIVSAHGGRLACAQSGALGGAAFIVDLPALNP
ncbi:MAG TPA: ATP-binding protein, partial [Spirochaetia bacterium]|nr:ATP-binding protein [Spirochaetia bacterium]